MKIILAITMFICCSCKVLATWSIIMIDPNTHEIGIAGASCTYNCYGIGKIIPNMGAIIVQAMSNGQAREKGVQMILAESTPEKIIEALRHPHYDPERQQYAVITIRYIGNPATYTGDSTHRYNGALTAAGVSVQGNTLTSESELSVIMEAIKQGKKELLNIAEILMIALEAGSASGGDKRCGDQKASSAFIIVAKPGDTRPYIDLNVFGQGKGGQNAVLLLRKRFERWKKRTDHKVTG